MTTTSKVEKAVLNFMKCDRGTTPIEYGLIGVLVSVAIIAGAGAIGSSGTVTLDSVTKVWP